MKRFCIFILIAIFINNSHIPLAYSNLETFLPIPGERVYQSPRFTPMVFKGMKIYPAKPLNVDFIAGNSDQELSNEEMKQQSQLMAKYFLTALTVPERDLWVNLSPYEQDRVIVPILGQTDLGKNLLEQDYLLKQLSSSLLYPETQLGKEFWRKVYQQTKERFGNTSRAINTFNKVWILPDQARVYEAKSAVYITNARLKVMVDADYQAISKNQIKHTHAEKSYQDSDSVLVMKEIIIPILEKEVNEGKNFAPLRQLYHALILAKWYKEKIKQSLLATLYQDKNKIKGLDVNDPDLKERIYSQYIAAYKKGVFNYIKEEQGSSKDLVARQYFAGGLSLQINLTREEQQPKGLEQSARVVGVRFNPSTDQAMSAELRRINLSIKRALDLEALKELFREALTRTPDGEIRDIEVNTIDHMTQQHLEELGLESEKNHLTSIRLIKRLKNIASARIVPISHDGQLAKFNVFEVTLPENGFIEGSNKFWVVLNETIPMQEALDHILKKENESTVRVYLPKSIWHLSKGQVPTFAKQMSIDENNIFYKGYVKESEELKAKAMALIQAKEKERQAQEEFIRKQEEAKEEQLRRLNLLDERHRREALSKQERLVNRPAVGNWAIKTVIVAAALAGLIRLYQTNQGNKVSLPANNDVKLALELQKAHVQPLNEMLDNIDALLKQFKGAQTIRMPYLQVAGMRASAAFDSANLEERKIARKIIRKLGEAGEPGIRFWLAQEMNKANMRGDNERVLELARLDSSMEERLNILQGSKGIQKSQDIQQSGQDVKKQQELLKENFNNLKIILTIKGGKQDLNDEARNLTAKVAIAVFEQMPFSIGYESHLLALFLAYDQKLTTSWFDNKMRQAKPGSQEEDRLRKIKDEADDVKNNIPPLNKTFEATRKLVDFYNSSTWIKIALQQSSTPKLLPDRIAALMAKKEFDLKVFENPELIKHVLYLMIYELPDLKLILKQQGADSEDEKLLFYQVVQYLLYQNGNGIIYDQMAEYLKNPGNKIMENGLMLSIILTRINDLFAVDNNITAKFIIKYQESILTALTNFDQYQFPLEEKLLKVIRRTLEVLDQEPLRKSTQLQGLRNKIKSYSPNNATEVDEKKRILDILGSPDQAMKGGIDMANIIIDQDHQHMVEGLNDRQLIRLNNVAGFFPTVINVSHVSSIEQFLMVDS